MNIAQVQGDRPLALGRLLKCTALLCFAVFVLAGCSRSMSDLEQKMQQARQNVSPEVPPLPEMRPYETFEYIPGDRRDPFFLPQPDRDGGPDRTRRREPLEAYTLDSLTMVGTFARGGERYGLVQDPEGIVHRVSTGNYMGQNDGRIVEINQIEIKLVELIPDNSEGWRERDAAMALNE